MFTGGGDGKLAVLHTLRGDQVGGDLLDGLGFARHSKDFEVVVVVEVDVGVKRVRGVSLIGCRLGRLTLSCG